MSWGEKRKQAPYSYSPVFDHLSLSLIRCLEFFCPLLTPTQFIPSVTLASSLLQNLVESVPLDTTRLAPIWSDCSLIACLKRRLSCSHRSLSECCVVGGYYHYHYWRMCCSIAVVHFSFSERAPSQQKCCCLPIVSMTLPPFFHHFCASPTFCSRSHDVPPGHLA